MIYYEYEYIPTPEPTPPAVIPTPTSDDNGKYLGVTDGDYELSNISGLLPNVTSSDNYKYLLVKDGVWTKDTRPGNVLSYSYNEETGKNVLTTGTVVPDWNTLILLISKGVDIQIKYTTQKIKCSFKNFIYKSTSLILNNVNNVVFNSCYLDDGVLKNVTMIVNKDLTIDIDDEGIVNT